jgi:hypothetical protein
MASSRSLIFHVFFEGKELVSMHQCVGGGVKYPVYSRKGL